MPPLTPDECPSCGAQRGSRYCQECGERRVEPREFGLAHYARQAFAGLTTFDGRLLGSLRSLVLSPGRLTLDWIRGARVKRLRPFQLFLLVNLVTVLLGEWFDLPGMSTTSEAEGYRPWRELMVAQSERMGLSLADYDALYKAKASGVARATTGVIVPVVALASFLLRFRRERRAGVHFVLATHAVAYLLLIPDLLFMGVVSPLLGSLKGGGDLAFWASNLIILVPLIFVTGWWYCADRRLYGTSRFQAAWRSLAACIASYLGGVLLHQMVIFHITIRALE